MILSKQPGAYSSAASATDRAARCILVIEDERDIAELIALHLTELPARVTLADEGPGGLKLALQQPWDAIVLDIRLPGLNGLDLCREVRAQTSHVPILMLTARSGELDRVLGLELGADDYLTKPFSVLELLARVRSLWRRADDRAGPPPNDEPSSLQRGPLQMNRLQHRVWLRGSEVALTGREFELLWCFAREPGRAFSRDELLDRVWDTRHDGYEHTVNTHINRLRNKIGAGFIHTVWGRGYRFEEPPADEP